MSEALIVRRGGGSTKLFAAIGVTYPAGSTCTCTDGVKTFTAKDASGKWVFPIPYAASWTVTATDGTNEKSQTVEITQSGQSVAVTLSYRLYLFEPGNQHTDITGGWTASYMGSITAEKISLISNYVTSTCEAYTNNVIDFTGYTTINFFFPSVQTPNYGFAGGANWGVADTNAGAFLVNGGLLAKNTVTNQQYTVDLGTVSGGRPKMQTLAGDEGNATSLECSHVWLE